MHFHGYVPHDESVRLLRSADLLFLPMHNVAAGWRVGIIPGKTYEYIAARRPILAAVPPGDAHDLLRSAGNAAICDPADVVAMRRELRAAIERKRQENSIRAPTTDRRRCGMAKPLSGSRAAIHNPRNIRPERVSRSDGDREHRTSLAICLGAVGQFRTTDK